MLEFEPVPEFELVIQLQPELEPVLVLVLKFEPDFLTYRVLLSQIFLLFSDLKDFSGFFNLLGKF